MPTTGEARQATEGSAEFAKPTAFYRLGDAIMNMKAENVSALSTSVIAFVTIIGLMAGFYYSLRATNTTLFYIIAFELLFVVAVWLFTSWIKGGMKNE